MRPMVRASTISTSRAQVLVQSCGQTEGARRSGAFMGEACERADKGERYHDWDVRCSGRVPHGAASSPVGLASGLRRVHARALSSPPRRGGVARRARVVTFGSPDKGRRPHSAAAAPTPQMPDFAALHPGYDACMLERSLPLLVEEGWPEGPGWSLRRRDRFHRSRRDHVGYRIRPRLIAMRVAIASKAAHPNRDGFMNRNLVGTRKVARIAELLGPAADLCIGHAPSIRVVDPCVHDVDHPSRCAFGELALPRLLVREALLPTRPRNHAAFMLDHLVAGAQAERVT